MNDELDFLLERPAPPRDSFRWATVTEVFPSLRIRFDGDTGPAQFTPATTTTEIAIGDRVWVQHHGRMAIILGVMQRGPVILGEGVNLNDITRTGEYHQSSNAAASVNLNYPAARAGLLTVRRSDNTNGTRVHIYQQYHDYTNAAFYVRTFYNSVWYAWKNLA